MTIPSLRRTYIAVALCLVLALPALPKSGGSIGPSNAVVFVGVGFLVYHETHKHPSITGCIVPGTDGLTLQNEKDKRAYALSGDSGALKAGERVTIKGKKVKDSAGKHSFRVEKVSKDFGARAP